MRVCPTLCVRARTKDRSERQRMCSVPFLHIATCTCLCVYICMCVLLLERVSCRARIDGRHSSPVNCPVISGIWAPGEMKVLGIYWGGEKKVKTKTDSLFPSDWELLSRWDTNRFCSARVLATVTFGCPWSCSLTGLMLICLPVSICTLIQTQTFLLTTGVSLHALFSWRHEEKGQGSHQRTFTENTSYSEMHKMYIFLSWPTLQTSFLKKDL